MSCNEKYEIWLSKVKDRKLLHELKKMSETEIESAFYKDLEFGTAGIRGIMGVGSNRINIYTIRKITQGVATYMKSHKMERAVVCFDSRNNSQLFAKETACVLGTSGITVFLAEELMPSPFLSFATRRLKADIGIMITASHNPKEYNGYKVYDSTGCQIREDAAAEISAKISGVDAFRLGLHTFDYYEKKGLVTPIPPHVRDDYLRCIACAVKGRANGLKVVYTPLNGTGYKLVPESLRSIGCLVNTVPRQNEPSGKFSTCPTPNPEKIEALHNGLKMLKSQKADLLIATDPDADRIGVAFMKGEEPYVLSGNEMGLIMCDYLLTHTSVPRPVIVRTLVSTDLCDALAQRYGAEMCIVPTGFKYIGKVINELERSGERDRFLLGFEESQGYLVGTHVRDKDAIVASRLFAIIACELKASGKTPSDKLDELYQKLGYQTDRQFVYSFEGQAGERRKAQLLDTLRSRNLVSIASRKVETITDYLEGGFDAPVNMIEYLFDGGRVIVRPSGTEPLIKIYASARVSKDENEKILTHIKKQFDEIFA